MIKLKTLFVRAAAPVLAGAVLSLAAQLQGQAAEINLVPAGATPSFMPDLYNLMRQATGSNSPADHKIKDPIGNYAAAPDHPLIKKINTDHPKIAEIQARMCGKDVCANELKGLSSAQFLIARIMMVEKLFHNGRDTDSETAIYQQFLSSVTPGADYTRWEKEKTEEAARRYIADSELQGKLSKWVSMRDIHAGNAAEQYRLRQWSLQRVSDIIHDVFGVPRVTVVLDKIPGDLRFSGVYLEGKDLTIVPDRRLLLVNYIPEAVENPDQMLTVIPHEAKHSVDAKMVRKMHARDIKPDDFRFNHAALINLNKDSYLLPCSNPAVERGCDQKSASYRVQYNERTAFTFSDSFYNTVSMIRLRQEIGQRKAPATGPVSNLTN